MCTCGKYVYSIYTWTLIYCGWACFGVPDRYKINSFTFLYGCFGRPYKENINILLYICFSKKKIITYI